jgi:hypothetical protein
MDRHLGQELAALARMTVSELRMRYEELFGEPTWVRHRAWLCKRIAWRIQALAEGDLSERARRRAGELANDADLRLLPPRSAKTAAAPLPAALILPGQRDARLPPPGTILTRTYKGQTLQVKVLGDGFEFAGAIYPSLSAVAKAITGSHCNGYLFFRVGPQGARQ